MTLAMADIGRLARSTSVVATMAERSRVSATAAESMQELVSRHAKFLEAQVDRLQAGAQSGAVGDVSRAVEALSDAHSALVRAHITLANTTVIHSPEQLMGARAGVADVRRGAASLAHAASKLQNAHNVLRSTEGVESISMANSKYVLHGEEAERWLATPHAPADPASLPAGMDEILKFDTKAQKRAMQAYAPISKLYFKSTMTGTENLAQSRHASLGTIYMGSHHRQSDPFELVSHLQRAGAPPMRALAANGVTSGPTAFLRDLGVFTVTNHTAAGKVRAVDALPHVVDQGQDLLVYTTGHLFPYPGADGDSLHGAAMAAVKTGAPIQRMAANGYQAKVDLAEDAARGRHPLNMTMGAIIPRKIEEGTAEFDEAVYHVNELMSQAREQDQAIIRKAYINQ